MAQNDVVDVLNDLIHTAEDGEKGFHEAAKIAQDARLILLFEECSRDCHGAVIALQAKVSALGGAPEHRGSVAGVAHRGWIRAKSAMSDNDITVLEEVERGEDHAKAAYTRALNTSNLPADVRALVQKQHEGTLRNHDRIRTLRNRYRAQAQG